MKRTVIWMLLLSLIIGSVVTALPISVGAASDAIKAPIAVDYRLDQPGSGMAAGVVTVTLPAEHNAEDIYLFWGDDNGKLPGYTAFSPFKVSGNIMMHRIPNGTVIPQGATRLLACTYSDSLGMSESFASFALPEGAAMTDEQLGTLLFEFQSVSDMHITPTYAPRKHHSDHMRAMLEDIMKVSPNSIGIFNNGDTVNNGYDADYQEFLDICAEYEDAPVIYSGIGNHELYRFGFDNNFPTTNDKFEDMKDAYWDFLGASVPQDAAFCGGTRFGSLSFSFVRNDCKFIFLGTDVLDQNNLGLTDATLTWLERELETEKGKGNPIFIIMHQPMTGTLAGSFKDGYGILANTVGALKTLLSKYPEVIMFNGHTHRDLNQYGIHYERDEKLPSIFGTSSVGYLARTYDSTSTETYKGSEGYYVYVYEDKVMVRGRDFLKGEWVPSAQFIVDLSEEGLEKLPEKHVEAPFYGSTATLYKDDNRLGGTVKCNMPINSNATAIALFFSNMDTGIMGSDPFATYEVDPTDTYFSCTITFADVALPYAADSIVVYAYSDTLGWSADCDIIDLRANIKGSSTKVSTSGAVKTNKSFYRLGEPIYVTATTGNEDDWIGMQLSSVSSGTKLWYDLGVSGVNQAFDITKQSNYTGVDGNDYKFGKLEAGTYQLAWMSSSKDNFQSGKVASDTITFTVVDMSEMLALGVPIGDGITAPNASALNKILDDAAKLKQSRFTPETWQVLQEAVEAAMLVRDCLDYTQEELDLAYDAVANAISALELAPLKPNSSQDSSDEGEDSQETSADESNSAETPSPSDEKPLFGCGSVVSPVSFCSFCVLLSWIPVAFKKKKSK